MEEGLKGRVILVLAILVVIFLIGTVSSCVNAGQMKTSRNKEMATRIELEEKIAKVSQEKAVLETKLGKLAVQSDEEKAAQEALKKALAQEQSVSQGLKDDLQKETKLREALEDKLKEALVTKAPNQQNKK